MQEVSTCPFDSNHDHDIWQIQLLRKKKNILREDIKSFHNIDSFSVFSREKDRSI